MQIMFTRNLKGYKYLPHYLLIVLGAFLSFAPTLQVGFMWDDHEMIEKNSHVHKISIRNISQAFKEDVFQGKGDQYFRPLQTLFNMIDYSLWRGNPFGFHLTNLVLHALAACCLFFFLGNLGFSKENSFGTAFTFSIHPIIVEQLLIIAGRAEIMSFLFLLLALIFALGKSKSKTILAHVFFLLACLSKESGVLFPFLLILIGWAFPKYRKSWTYYIGSALTLVFYFVLRHQAVSMEIDLQAIHWDRFLFRDGPLLFWEYVRILVFPFDLHSHRRMSFSFVQLVVCYGLTILLLILLWNPTGKARGPIISPSPPSATPGHPASRQGFHHGEAYPQTFPRVKPVVPGEAGWKKPSKKALFFLMWFILCFVPKMPLLATNALMLDHWAYPASVGFFGMIFLVKFKKKTKRILLWSLAGFWVCLSWFNISQRNTEKELYHWALHYKSSSIVPYNLGLLYYDENNIPEARRYLEMAWERGQKNGGTANALALVDWREGKQKEAVQKLNEWIEKRPDFYLSYINRATILGGEAGLRDLDTYLKYNPSYEKAWILKGILHLEMKALTLARASFERAREINPHNSETYNTLGGLSYQLGQREEAHRLWKKALHLNPENANAAENLRRFQGIVSENEKR